MSNNNLVNSVLISAEILALIGDKGTGMRLAEIAIALDLKTPRVHNLVKTLIACGFVEKRKNLLYIGSTFITIAEQQLQNGLSQLAEHELRDLYQQFPHGVVVLGLAVNSEIRQTIRISPDRPQVFQRVHGDTYNLYANASGLVGLAFFADNEVLLSEAMHSFAEYGAVLWKNQEALNDYLAKVREEKIAISPFDTNLYFRAAVPILDSKNRLLAVMGISFPTNKFSNKISQQDIINELKMSRKRLERKIR